MTATLSIVQTKHDQEFLDEIGCECFNFDVDYTPEKWSEVDMKRVISFCDELEDIGITTKEEFDDRSYGGYKAERGMTPEAVFTEEQIDDQQLVEETWIVVNYQATWDRNLRFDFNTVTCPDGYVMFFANH
jgi:hypothetical protein